MRKEKGKMEMRKLMVEMLIIISFVVCVIGWVSNEWNKRYPEPVKIEKQEAAFKSTWERDARIRHIQSLLSGVETGTVGITRQGTWELKDELRRLLGDSRPVKIYAGLWHKTYLEVIGK